MKIYFMTYADPKFSAAKKQLQESAAASGFFDEVLAFGPDDLSHSFTAQFRSVLRLSRGGGYWIWKIFLVRQLLGRMQEGDVLVYADAGCMLNTWAEERFSRYIEMVAAAPSGSLAFSLPHPEYAYTKQEVFDRLHCGEDIRNSAQLMATVFLLRKCAAAEALAEACYQVLEAFPELFTDALDPAIQHQAFVSHQHDQSIWSVIRKQSGTEIIPDETYFTDYPREGAGFPFWATRLRQ